MSKHLELYQKVREAARADPDTARIVLQALTDGQRDAREELERRASNLEFMWMAALGFTGAVDVGAPKATRHIMAQAMITHLRATPQRSPLEEEALRGLEEEFPSSLKEMRP